MSQETPEFPDSGVSFWRKTLRSEGLTKARVRDSLMIVIRSIKPEYQRKRPGKMLIKEFRKRAKELNGQVTKVGSKYWGKIWYEAIFVVPAVTLSVVFEENKPAVSIQILSHHGKYITAEELRQSAEMMVQFAELLEEINSPSA